MKETFWDLTSFQNSKPKGNSLYCIKLLAPAVQRMDSAIHWINQYPVDSIVCFVNTYPLGSDLSTG